MADATSPRQTIDQATQRMLHRLAERRMRLAEPIMPQEEFEQLPPAKQVLLICNMPGCGQVVSTHGMLCVEHTEEVDDSFTIPINVNRK